MLLVRINYVLLDPKRDSLLSKISDVLLAERVKGEIETSVHKLINKVNKIFYSPSKFLTYTSSLHSWSPQDALLLSSIKTRHHRIRTLHQYVHGILCSLLIQFQS